MTIDDLRAALGHANVAAFLRLIREKESGQGDDAYTVINGGAHFTDASRHPYHGITTGKGGRAAGAYQFLGTTWARLCEQYGFPDFGPESQDLGAVALIAGRRALNAVIAGDLETAIRLCRPEWTSLPGAAESRASWTMAAAVACFEHWGGVVTYPDRSDAPAPIEERTVQPQEKAVDPLSAIALFGPMIVNAIPQVAKLFDRKAETPDKIAAATEVIKTVVASTGAVNEQHAVELLKDETKRQAAVQAVINNAMIQGMLEVGGGIEKAREHNAALIAQADHWWKLLLNPVFLVTLMLLPMVYMFVWALLPLLGKVSADVISQTMGYIIGAVLGGVVGFWMGQTYNQNNKRASDAPATGVAA